jgi:TolB-like protein
VVALPLRAPAVAAGPIQPAATVRGARLGVLPLRVLGGADGTDDSGLSIGLAEEITAALARFRWLFLADSSSLAAAAARAGGARDAQAAAAREFGLDFLLSGTLQRVERRVRINLGLLDLRAPESAGEHRLDPALRRRHGRHPRAAG